MQVASGGLCLAASVLWSLPLLAAGLVALLRYGFGSLFVVGESVASVLLRSTGADIAGTIHRLQASPLRNAAEAGIGLLLATASAGLTLRAPAVAALLATGSAVEAWWYGMPVISMVLTAPICVGIAGGIAALRG